jgi:Tc5 transposase DNA-binding domain
VLAQGIPPGVRNTYRALAEHHDVARSTLHYRAHGRRSKEKKAQSQQYLTPCEEKAVVNFLLQMAEFGQLVRIKHILSLAFSVARQRSTNKPPKPPGRNWARAFEKRHPELKTRRNRPLDWDRYNIYNKVVHWFEVIGRVLQDPAILPENVYNMDETGVMLSMLGSIKVLVSKDDLQGYKGARVKRIVITAIECISANSKCCLLGVKNSITTVGSALYIT